MVFLGIDPGLASTGYGVVEGDGKTAAILDFGCIRTSAREETPRRLAAIHNRISELITQWKPVGVSVEDAYAAALMPKAALLLGEVRGAVAVAAVNRGLPVVQLAPRSVKQALTGHGAADKEQMERALRRMTGWAEPIHPTHASDALAIAIVGLSRWLTPERCKGTNG